MKEGEVPMFTATIAEILHPAKFAALVAHFIEAGLLKPKVADRRLLVRANR
jgi:hypothetical protein